MASAGRVTWQDVLIFWTKVLVVCLILGIGAFFIGRNYLGNLLTESEIREGAPELLVQVTSPSGEVTSGEPAPPAKLEVSVEEREASDHEAATAAREMGLSADADHNGESDRPRSTGDADTDAEAASNRSQDEADQQSQPTADSQDAEEGRFVVIAGSFANPANSEAMLKELQAKGYRPYITRVTVGDKTYNRVNVGAFPNRGQADRLAEELTGAGYEATVGVR